MDRINKNRKGIVFGLMTEEEQKCLKRQKNIVGYFGGEWGEMLDNNLAQIVPYWCPDWDEPTGEELIGKCCKLWGRDANEYAIDIVVDFNHKASCPYITKHAIYKKARLATQEDFDIMMEVNK